MPEDKGEMFRKIAWASTIGTTLAASTVVGLVLGIYLDKRFDTRPYLTLAFLLLGIAAGFVNIYRGMKKFK